MRRRMMREPRVPENDARVNALLGKLPPHEWALVVAKAKIVTLDYAQVYLRTANQATWSTFP